MTRRQRVAVATLFCLEFALNIAGFFSLTYQSHAFRVAQQHAGQAVEAKLCATFSRLGALQPPPGDPQANPSRAYLQNQHAALVELGRDVGC